MATTRKKTIGVQAPDDSATPAAPHQGVNAEDLTEDVERVLAEAGENGSHVIVWRMKDNKPGDWDYVARIPAAEYTNEYLKEQFGGGEYKLVIVDAVQGPLNPVFMSIDRRFTGKLFGSTTAVVPSSGGGDSGFKDNLLQLLLVKALESPREQRSDLDTVLRVAEVFKGGSGGGDAVTAAASILTLAQTLANTMNPPDGIAGVASQFLPLIDKLASGAPRVAIPPTRRLPAPATPAVPTPPTTTVTPNPEARVAGTIVPAWLAPFKSVAPMLVTLADTGGDSSLYADVALDQMSANETLFAAAVESMNAGHLLSDLYALAPAMKETEKRKGFAAELVARIEEGIRELMASEETNQQGTGG